MGGVFLTGVNTGDQKIEETAIEPLNIETEAENKFQDSFDLNSVELLCMHDTYRTISNEEVLNLINDLVCLRRQ